jgi:hypothetical protein
MMHLSRAGDGDLILHLNAAGLRRLRSLPERLRARVESRDFTDKAVRRLYPRFSDDPNVQRDLEDVAAADLRERKRAPIDAFAATLAAPDAPLPGMFRLRLNPEQTEGWIGFLNDMRLMLSVELGLETDVDADRLHRHPPPPMNSDAGLYLLLTNLQGTLIEVLDGSS